MPLESILGPVVTAWIAHVVAGLTAFAFLYGAAKILWTRLSGKPFPANRLTRGLDAFVELGTNVLGFVNKLKHPDGTPLIANPEVQRRDALIAEMQAALAELQRRAAPLAVIAEKAGAVAVSETRPSLVVTAGDAPFDPAQRQEIAPDVVAEAQRIVRERDGGA